MTTFENGNDTRGTFRTQLVGGVDTEGRVRAFAVNEAGQLVTTRDGGGSTTTSSGGVTSTDPATATNQQAQLTRLTEIRDFTASVTKSAPISISAAGDHTIITPTTTTKSLRISGLYFTAASAVTITLKAGTTTLSGAMSLTDHAADYSYPIALSAGQNFVINLGSAIAVSGYALYWEV